MPRDHTRQPAGVALEAVALGQAGLRRGRQEWADYLRPLLACGVIRDEKLDGLQWAPVSELFVGLFIEAAQRRRADVQEKGRPFQPLIYHPQKGVFVEAGSDRADRVHRQEKADRWTLFDLCENAWFLDGRKAGEGQGLIGECAGLVRNLFRGRCPGILGTEIPGRVVTTIARALKAGAAVADLRWKDVWAKRANLSGKRVKAEIELKMRLAIGHEIGAGFGWITAEDPNPAMAAGLVFIAEGLGGRRNLESGLPFFSLSLSAVRVTGGGFPALEPVAAGVAVPSVSQLYIGVPGENGGALLIDERLSTAYPLAGEDRRPGGKLTVGVHHSRSRIERALAFVSRVSEAMPAAVDKEIAIGSGGFSLALTSAGVLAAYFEPTTSAISAYAGAVLVLAAAGREEAVTDLDGMPWFQGDPLRRSGILAWSNRALQERFGETVLGICRSLPE